MNSLAPSTTTATVTTRDPKGLKFLTIAEAAYNKAGLSEEEAQRVNDTPGLAKKIADFIEENRYGDKYKDEERKSSYTYPPEYKLESVERQIDILRQHFPKLNPDKALRYMREVYSSLVLPDWVEGPFVVIGDNTIGANYCEEVEMIFGAIKSTRSFENYRKGQIDSAHLQRTEKTLERWELLNQAQPGDFKILPGQLGLRHRGRSSRRALECFEPKTECGFGSRDGGCIALTHPKRFVRSEELDIDLPGDKFSPDGDGVFSEAPCLDFRDWLGFGAWDVGLANGSYGSASWYSPQQ